MALAADGSLPRAIERGALLGVTVAAVANRLDMVAGAWFMCNPGLR